ncbi:MAG: DUF3566 domain-containing protein [Candidatus Omnitrophota bacterium]
MRKVEYKSFDLASVFKLFASICFVLVFVFALFSRDFSNPQFKQLLESIPFVGSLLTGFMGALIISVVGALIFGIYFVLMAVIYNIFAMISGGIMMNVEDKQE